MTTTEAMDHLCEALMDKEYRYGWQANIAMAFKDEAARGKHDLTTKQGISDCANKAAAVFLERLSPSIEVPDMPGAMAVQYVHEQVKPITD
jgi:hypothetical protein